MTATRPSPSEPRSYHFPEFEQCRLSNGMAVIVAPVHKLPLISINAVVDAGAECESVEQAGVAQLTAQLLTEGTISLDAIALTEKLELLGTSVASSADWDFAAASLSAMTERFTDVLSILGDVVMNPALPERELERLKAERIAELLQLRTEPRTLADESFSEILYDSTSRYSKSLGGTESTVKGISIADVRAFHRARYTPQSTTLIVVGDITADAAVAAAERIFGEWKGNHQPKPDLHATTSRKSREVHLITKENAPQSELRIGHLGLSRRSPDYFDVMLMNAILGGLFSSRVNLNLREKHGYTYGAFSHFDWRHEAGPFVVATAVKSDVTAAAIREVLSEIDRMRAELVTEDEMSLARDYLVGVFPIRFETTAAISSALASIVVHGLPADYFDSYRSAVAAVTREGVLRAAQRNLRPEELQVVVVGDAGAVEGLEV